MTSSVAKPPLVCTDTHDEHKQSLTNCMKEAEDAYSA